MGADAAPSAAHRIELGEFELLEANNIAHLHQAREQLLSHFQRCHKKKQGTMPGHSAATTAHFSSRKKPPDPLEKTPKPHQKLGEAWIISRRNSALSPKILLRPRERCC